MYSNFEKAVKYANFRNAGDYVDSKYNFPTVFSRLVAVSLMRRLNRKKTNAEKKLAVEKFNRRYKRFNYSAEVVFTRSERLKYVRFYIPFFRNVGHSICYKIQYRYIGNAR